MILEIQLPIPRPDLPLIHPLPTRNRILDTILPVHVPHFRHDEQLAHAQRAQREAVAQPVRRSAVDLARDDARRVAHRLLEADGRGTPVVRRHVHVEPGQVYPWSDVDGYGAEEGGEVFHSLRWDWSVCIIGAFRGDGMLLTILLDGEKDDVSYYPKDVGK